MCFEEKIIKSKIYNEEKKVGLQNDKWVAIIMIQSMKGILYISFGFSQFQGPQCPLCSGVVTLHDQWTCFVRHCSCFHLIICVPKRRELEQQPFGKDVIGGTLP